MDLKTLRSLVKLDRRRASSRRHYIVDSLLALGSISVLTNFISLFHLYPKIPDSFLIYLLVILALAGLRGIYASLLASILAFFSFDFLFIPPVHNLTVAKFSDVLTLIVFLVTAVLTSQLTSALKRRAEDADRRVHETRILYDVLRTTNKQEDARHQLTVLAHSINEVYASRGIRNCSFLLPYEGGEFTLQIGTHSPSGYIHLSADESAKVQWVLAHVKPINIEENKNALIKDKCPFQLKKWVNNKKVQEHNYIRLIPLKIEQHIIGILRLSIEEGAQRPLLPSFEQEYEHPTSQGLFFSAFLEQAVTIIEQGRLRHESLQAKVLQKTDVLRSALLSSVSHDLRTPLATIKTSATSLQQKNVTWNEDARQSFISAIEREADRLNRLVENLLDMSRIEAGALHSEKVWYPLDELVHDVLDRMQTQLRGREVRVEIAEMLPPVEIDYVQIDQVVTNIIENALHHTPNGSPIDVNIYWQEKQIHVSVADRGPGILPGEQERIFDKFYRILGDHPVSNYSRGSGLGLAICRALIEAHTGSIRVETREGGGALFHFTLPLNEFEDTYE